MKTHSYLLAVGLLIFGGLTDGVSGLVGAKGPNAALASEFDPRCPKNHPKYPDCDDGGTVLLAPPPDDTPFVESFSDEPTPKQTKPKDTPPKVVPED